MLPADNLDNKAQRLAVGIAPPVAEQLVDNTNVRSEHLPEQDVAVKPPPEQEDMVEAAHAQHEVAEGWAVHESLFALVQVDIVSPKACNMDHNWLKHCHVHTGWCEHEFSEPMCRHMESSQDEPVERCDGLALVAVEHEQHDDFHLVPEVLLPGDALHSAEG